MIQFFRQNLADQNNFQFLYELYLSHPFGANGSILTLVHSLVESVKINKSQQWRHAGIVSLHSCEVTFSQKAGWN